MIGTGLRRIRAATTTANARAMSTRIEGSRMGERGCADDGAALVGGRTASCGVRAAGVR
jgi:hypothetical protein